MCNGNYLVPPVMFTTCNGNYLEPPLISNMCYGKSLEPPVMSISWTGNIQNVCRGEQTFQQLLYHGGLRCEATQPTPVQKVFFTLTLEKMENGDTNRKKTSKKCCRTKLYDKAKVKKLKIK
jgi:hypothetical protein